MLRFSSRMLVSKTSIYSGAYKILHTTGSPTQIPSRLLHNKPKFCKYPSLTIHSNKVVNYRRVLNYTTHRKTADDNLGHLSSVQKLIDVYMSKRKGQDPMLPFDALDSILKCTKKSAKEVIILLEGSDTSNKFVYLLKDIEASLDEEPQMQSIVSILSSLGEIFVRQKTFLNQTGIDIFHMTFTMTSSLKEQESHTAEFGKSLFLKYESLILSRIDCVSLKEVVNVLWCYAAAGCGNKQFYEKLRNRILGLWTAELIIEDIAKIVCSFAKLKSTIDLTNIMKKAENHLLLQGVVGLGKEEIIDILFAFASLQHGSKKFYQEILTEILNRESRSFTPAQICKTLWSFTKVSSKHISNLSDLLNQFESEIIRRGVKRFNIRGLTVITWSSAETPHSSKRLLTSLRNEITRRNIRTFAADDLSVLLKSLAKLKNRMHTNKFFSKVDKELLGRGLRLFNNRHLATLLWSFAEVGYGSSAFYDMMKRELMKRGFREFTAVEFSQVIWSFAKAGEKLNVTDVLLQVNYDVTKLSLRQLALVLWSYAVAGVAHLKLIKQLNSQIVKQDLSQANHPMICQIMYGLATFKQVAPVEKVTKFFEKSLVQNGVKLLQYRQLAVLVWSFSEISQFCVTTKIFEILGQEVCCRSARDFMPSDLCRILWGFANVDHLTDTSITFHTLTKELLRRGLGHFSIGQVAMASVSISTANQWNAVLIHLFEEEIVNQRNERSFDDVQLCLLAKSFVKMNPLDSVKLFSWLEEEVIGRDVNSFLPKDLMQILEVLVDRKATKIDFFKTVTKQLMMSSFKNYSNDDIRNVCGLLTKAGVNVQKFASSSLNK